jgi:ketosteroid isomerase-like protein
MAGRRVAIGVAMNALAAVVGAPAAASAPDDPVAIVQALRAESNAAIAAHDATRLRATLHDDFYEFHGPSGTLDSGGDETAQSFRDEEFKDPTFVSYVRTTDSMTAAESGDQVAEYGHWAGSWRKPDGLMQRSGVYLAMWTRTGAGWRLQWEAFVPLRCSGSRACAPMP